MKKFIFFILISTIALFFSCSEDQPTEPTNNAPIIQSISASPSSIKVNETNSLSCVATDADGDNLTYTWSSDNGTFPNGTSDSFVKWKAPSEEGTYKIEVIVSDGEKAVNDEVEVLVKLACSAPIIYEGKTYNTVKIGDQCWFLENLDVGTMINSTNGGFQQTDNGTIEKYCYNNNESNCDTYGGLYEWTEAMQYVTTEGTQGICPSGWHIPTKGEYETLQTYVNNEAVKLIDQSQTMNGHTATNETGFSALFAGLLYYNTDSFDYLGRNTFFWSSTETGSYANFMYLYYDSSVVYFYNRPKNYGYSVRCLKD